MRRRINIDMDHVVADFTTHYQQVTGFPWDNSKSVHERWSPLDGKETQFFRNMPAYAGAAEFVRTITKLGESLGLEVRFLTAIPSRHHFPTAHAEKIDWVVDKLGSKLEVAIGPFAKDKASHCRAGDILIDDNPLNINQWRAAGGIGILHTALAISLTELRNHLSKVK